MLSGAKEKTPPTPPLEGVALIKESQKSTPFFKQKERSFSRASLRKDKSPSVSLISNKITGQILIHNYDTPIYPAFGILDYQSDHQINFFRKLNIRISYNDKK